MESNGEQSNNDLQIQNLVNNEELHHSDNKEEETKPEDTGIIQTNVPTTTETETNVEINESTTAQTLANYDNDDVEVSKTREIDININNGIVEQTDQNLDNQKESDKLLLDKVQDEIKQQTENAVSLINELGNSNDNNNNEEKDEANNTNEDNVNINNKSKKNNKISFNNVDNNGKHIKCNNSDGNGKSISKTNKYGRFNSAPVGKKINNQGLRNSSRRKNTGETTDNEVKTREIKEQDELDEIETERRRVIAGDISIHGSEDEGEDEEKEEKKEKPYLKVPPSSSGGKSTKSNKYVKLSKKNLKNYRSFVSVKPSCNRYMANMWNNYVYSIHKMNILNIKKTVDNNAPKKYAHIDQNLKAKQLKKDKEDEIRKNNQNILNRMIYQGRNNVGTTNLDDNNDVIEPVFRSLHAEQNKRLEDEMNRESLTLLKRLKERKPSCSVEQWEKDRLITEVYLRNISIYPENYPVRQKSKQKHVPPIKKNENEEIKREKSPLETTESIYSAGMLKANRTRTTGTSGLRKKKQNDLIVPNSSSSGKGMKMKKNDKLLTTTVSKTSKDDSETVRQRKPKQRTLSESTRQSFKLYGDNSVNQNQDDLLNLERKKDGKLNKVPENHTTSFDHVSETFENAKSDIKDAVSESNQVSEDVPVQLNETQNNPPAEEIPTEDVTVQLNETQNNSPVEEIPNTEIDN
jgi:hypothetical protein